MSLGDEGTPGNQLNVNQTRMTYPPRKPVRIHYSFCYEPGIPLPAHRVLNLSESLVSFPGKTAGGSTRF